MKIEIAESLLYSWLLHVKKCRLVHTNWKVSGQWAVLSDEKKCVSEEIFKDLHGYFEKKYDYKLFGNSSLSQVVKQGEIDLLGVEFGDGEPTFYAVDVAFHAGGLNYASKKKTICKVIGKYIRTALSIYGYLNARTAEIVFATPKINNELFSSLAQPIKHLNQFFKEKGLNFKFVIIANENFEKDVVKAIVDNSKDISDTSELFVRAYQLLALSEKSKMRADKNCENASSEEADK